MATCNFSEQEVNMAEQEILNLLEAEPSRQDGGVITGSDPNIPAMREQLAILVSTGKAKEAIGVQLSHEQVKRLTDKDVEKYNKRYETYVGAKTTETLIESFIMFATKAAGLVLPIKNVEALQSELKKDYIITKELSDLAGNLALKCGRFLALANAVLITTKHIDFNELKSSEDVKLEEIPSQSSPSTQLSPIAE